MKTLKVNHIPELVTVPWTPNVKSIQSLLKYLQDKRPLGAGFLSVFDPYFFALHVASDMEGCILKVNQREY